ncbi:formin-H isoform X2 [Triplophysa rosa]|uniref:formin-H isoform X2 n=1 Tax=Triplophysa rosa TaxID=992332 RepID=UPI002545E812|nr:formin-H isoform X2 [Triplophysa rosa]
MDHKPLVVPQLSNEMQLSLMSLVKAGKLSIDQALIQAGRGTENEPSQYNFSVRKFNRYIWQKRVLQVDFTKNILCSIEKGIVKRQLLFSDVKNCHDAAGTRFSISFKGRPDYELEAASSGDKHRIMQLVNHIIYNNIYSLPVDTSLDVETPNGPPENLKEEHLLLQRGGLASFKWKKYEAHLQTGLLTLLPVAPQPAEASVSSSESVCHFSDVYASVNNHRCDGGDGTAVVIHLSDGNVRVETSGAPDTFTVLNDRNDFLFRIPKTDHMTSEFVQNERDAWVKAIKQLCIDWKRKSQCEPLYEVTEMQRNHNGITETNSQPEYDIPNNHTPPPVPPTPRPRLPRPSPAQPEVVPTAAEPEPNTSQRSEPELKPTPTAQIQNLSTAEEKPSPAFSFSPASAMLVPGPVGNQGVPPAPLPPPMPKKTAKQLTNKMKAFHWDLVAQDKIEKSTWARKNPKKIEIDTSRLYELFCVRDQDTVGKSESNINVEIMLNAKIAHNFNIFLKSFPVPPEELKDKLLIINEDDGGLSDEHIASLRRYVPTADDIEMYKSYKGDVNELHVVDRYMLEMCYILNLSARLDLLLMLRELPICMEDLTPLIIQKIRMCQQLVSCESFVSVLEYLLTLGNYINHNAGKEKAKGFRLSSLTKVSQLRGNYRKFTLLHALVEQIMLREPSLATFFLELAEFEMVSGASVKGLTAEVDVVKNEFQKVMQYRKAHKRKNVVNQQPKFFRDLKMAIERYETDLSQLTKRCEEMRKLYTDILVKFGEPLDQDSQELFGWVGQFINDFKKVYSEYDQ